MRALPDVGMEPGKARIRLQLPPANDAAGCRVFEIAGKIRPPSRRAHRQFAEVCQPAVANDGRATARGFDQVRGSKEPGQHGGLGGSRSGGANTMSTNTPNTKDAMSVNVSPSAASGQESYVVTEGKKRGSTREVRDEAAHDRFYTVVKVHGGDAILTDNWHTNEVFGHLRNNFEGITFAMRTLEAWGAMFENDKRAYYTAGGRVWVLDLEACAAKKPRLPGTGKG